MFLDIGFDIQKLLGQFSPKAVSQVKQAQEDVANILSRFYAAREVVFTHLYFLLEIFCAQIYHSGRKGKRN